MLFRYLAEGVVSNDAESNILATNDLYEVSFSIREIVELDLDLVTVREVCLCALTEVTDYHPSSAGRESCRAGVCRERVVEVNRKPFERIHRITRCILRSLELCPGSLIHNDNGIGCFVGKSTESLCDNTDRGSSGNNADTDCVCGSRSGQSRDLADQFALRLLGDLICEFVIDVVEELLAAEIHRFVRNSDELLDGSRDHIDDTEGRVSSAMGEVLSV